MELIANYTYFVYTMIVVVIFVHTVIVNTTINQTGMIKIEKQYHYVIQEWRLKSEKIYFLGLLIKNTVIKNN